MKTTQAIQISQMTDNVERDNALIQEDKWITVTDRAKLDISCLSGYSIVHKDLVSHKICVG
jgi:hypothetical protein